MDRKSLIARGLGLQDLVFLGLVLLIVAFSGCGTTKRQTATEQLVVSDAVDHSVATIDFHLLAGKRVFLDTRYMASVKGIGFVNADYIVSALRQQMAAARCLLEDDADSAEYIVEVRVGALGTDQHDVTYGIPASAGLSTAASLMPNAPPIPMIPEIAIAKRNDQVGVAKIAVFAYHRDTREPIWQSGIAKARSTSKDFWLFGAGPFQLGSVHEHTRFAGEDLKLPLLTHEDADSRSNPMIMNDGVATRPDPMTLYDHEVQFVQLPKLQNEVKEATGTVAQPASFAKEKTAPDKPAQEKTASKPALATQTK